MSMEEASIVDEEGCLDSGGAEETQTPRDRAERRGRPAAAPPAIGDDFEMERNGLAGDISPNAGHSVVGNGV